MNKFLFIGSILFLLLFFLDSQLFARDFMYRISAISIISNTKTADYVIRDEIGLTQGSIISSNTLAVGLSNSSQGLKNLGIFSMVALSSSPTIDGPISNSTLTQTTIITAEIHDKWTVFPVPLYYYDSRFGNVFSFEFSDFNFLGLNHQIDLEGVYGDKTRSVSLKYTYPRVWSSYFDASASFSWNNYQDSAYNNGIQSYDAVVNNWELKYKLLKRDTLFDLPVKYGLKGFFESVTNEVHYNTTGISDKNGNRSYIAAQLKIGDYNIEDAILWGSKTTIETGYYTAENSPNFILKHTSFSRIFEKSFWGYRLGLFASPGVTFSLTSDKYTRGIDVGEIRGNYGSYGNIEFKQFIIRLTILTPVDIYADVFTDASCAWNNGETLGLDKTALSSGLGIRIFPVEVGGGSIGIRMDFGLSLNKLYQNGNPEDMPFFAFALAEVF